MIYLLDSDKLILMMRGLKMRVPRTESQRQRFLQGRLILGNCRHHAQSGHQLTCSAITIGELEFGARNSENYTREMRHTRTVLAGVFPLDYTAGRCAEAYGAFVMPSNPRGDGSARTICTSRAMRWPLALSS
jgi:predicted nucleic acid-binding protein